MNEINVLVSVDSGMFIVSDASIIETNKDKYKDQIFNIPNGRYKVKVSIEDTWNGKIEKEDIVQITSGELCIVDPCYIIKNENWNTWLMSHGFEHDRDFEIKISDGIVCDEMGGDGVYETIIIYEEIYQ